MYVSMHYIYVCLYVFIHVLSLFAIYVQYVSIYVTCMFVNVYVSIFPALLRPKPEICLYQSVYGS